MSGGSDFWSRRKQRVAREAEAEARAAEAAALAARDAELEEKTDEQILEDLGLPDPDTLEPGADFRAFMQKAVPERLRRRALRRLWLSNPALANLDGLLDYGEDFTDSATVIENLQTAYQVGKGMMAHVEELAREAEAKAAEKAEPAPEAPQEMADPDQQEPRAVVTATPEEEAGEADRDGGAPVFAYAEDDEQVTALPPRRRMQFTFDAGAGSSA